MTEPITVTLTLSSGLAGEWEISRPPFSWCEGHGGWPVHDTVVVCPKCLRHWLQWKTPYESYEWKITSWCCQACDRPSALCLVPGSLLEIPGTGAFDENLLMALPEELLRREFELTMKYLA